MDRQPVLDTQRLHIRPLEEADREPLFTVASDPMVWEQHPVHDRWRREVFDAFFDECLASGGGLAVIRKDKDRIVGHTRLDKYDPEEGGVIEIGWTYLERPCWGKGMNTEMKAALLRHVFANVALVELRVGDTNYRSRNALEAIGAVRTDRYELGRYDGKRIVHLVYEITRESFCKGPLSGAD